jgi:ribosomal protein S19
MRFNLIDPRTKRRSFLSGNLNSNARVTKKSEVYTYLRGCKIPPSVKDKRVAVYNGFYFSSFIVKPWMIGYKFGVFSRTKKLGTKIHEKKKKGKGKVSKK